MGDTTSSVDRRRFLAGGLSAAALVGLWQDIGQAQGSAPTAAEKANIDVVNQFCKAWNLSPANAAKEKMLSLMTADCTWQIGKSPAAVGRAAIGERMTKFLANTRFELNVFDTFARGDLVVNSRIDSNVHPDATDTPYPIVGIFYLKGGKIAEWYELLMQRRMQL